jgi:chromosome segregation ATPase
MELDELEKRLEWLDSERQKSNLEIKELRDKVSTLEDLLQKQKKETAALGRELKTVSTTTGRVSQFDSALEQVRTDLVKQVADLEKKVTANLRSLEKQEKDDQNSLGKRIGEIQTVIPMVTEVKKSLQNRLDEESRLSQRLDTLNSYYENLNLSIKTFEQANKRFADDNQLNNQRVSDLQVETTTLRKRLEEERNRGELNVAALQKLETSLKGLMAQEAERKQSQIAFVEKMSLSQIERDNTWKAWQEQINSLGDLSTDYAQKIAALEATHKAIKQSQVELDEVNLRFDRRINELTEMHRLNEERFRQEWLTFKSDDQKRWTNYQLTQEEQQQDDSRQMAKLLERIGSLEDELENSKETISLLTEESEKQLKSVFTVFHDLIESFDQTFPSK